MLVLMWQKQEDGDSPRKEWKDLESVLCNTSKRSRRVNMNPSRVVKDPVACAFQADPHVKKQR